MYTHTERIDTHTYNSDSSDRNSCSGVSRTCTITTELAAHQSTVLGNYGLHLLSNANTIRFEQKMNWLTPCHSSEIQMWVLYESHTRLHKCEVKCDVFLKACPHMTRIRLIHIGMQIGIVIIVSALVFKLHGHDNIVRVTALPCDQSRFEKHGVLRDTYLWRLHCFCWSTTSGSAGIIGGPVGEGICITCIHALV